MLDEAAGKLLEGCNSTFRGCAHAPLMGQSVFKWIDRIGGDSKYLDAVQGSPADQTEVSGWRGGSKDLTGGYFGSRLDGIGEMKKMPQLRG